MELPTFLIDCPAVWDRDSARPEDVYFAADDDGKHLFVPLVGIFGRLDKEWERRFFPGDTTKDVVEMDVTRAQAQAGSGKAEDEGYNSSVDDTVKVRNDANEKN